MNGMIKGGAGQIDLTFHMAAGGRKVGATPNSKIYNTENYDNSLYKVMSNWLMSHCKYY